MEKVTFFGAFARMWANTFDYKGRASRKEYWFPFIIQCLIALAAAGLLYASLSVTSGGLWFCLGAFALLGYLVLSFLPWLSLTVRRLRDAGKSGWWTLLVLVVGVGAIILMILCTAGSTIYNAGTGVGFDPVNNMQECVYGPPEIFDPSQNEIEDVYGPPFTDPEPYSDDELNDEPIVDPDELNDEPIVDPDEQNPINNNGKNGKNGKDADFDPEDNIEPVIYGPPEMFDPSQNELNEVYGPPEMFE